MVLPFSPASLDLLKSANQQQLSLAFVNTDQDSEMCSSLLQRLAQTGICPGFVFNAAAFARLGENPFLYSYKQKLRRFVSQLDLEDSLTNGAPAPLAAGHAEIKEMISCLRAAGFDGHMVLGAGNRAAGDDLAVASHRLIDLLNNM